MPRLKQLQSFLLLKTKRINKPKPHKKSRYLAKTRFIGMHQKFRNLQDTYQRTVLRLFSSEKSRIFCSYSLLCEKSACPQKEMIIYNPLICRYTFLYVLKFTDKIYEGKSTVLNLFTERGYWNDSK